MLGSFHKLSGPNKPGAIPDQMIEYFNSLVPEDYRYTQNTDHPEMCWLVSNGSAGIQIDGLKPKLTAEQRTMLGNGGEPNQKGLELLLSNALEPIELDASDAQIKLKKQELPIGFLIRTVDNEKYLHGGKYYLFRHPIEFTLPLQCGSTTLKVKCVQQKSHNIHVSHFESIDSALVVSLDFDTRSESGHFKFNFNNSKSSSAKQCRDAAIIYDGLASNKATIDNKKLFPIPHSEKRPIAPFWQEVYDIQEALGTTIDTASELDIGTFASIERLNRSIMEGKAVGLGYRPTSVDVVVDGEPNKTNGEDICRLMFPTVLTVKVFQQELRVNACIGLSGIILGEPEQKSEKPGQYSYSITYTDDFMCTVLYLASSETDDSKEHTEHISDILFAPLPNGRRY
jgi:hypothetical protein